MAYVVVWAIASLLITAIGFVFCLLLAWPTMLLWNWIVPSLFGVRCLNLWEMTGLMCLVGFVVHGARLVIGLADGITRLAIYPLFPPDIQAQLKKVRDINPR